MLTARAAWFLAAAAGLNREVPVPQETPRGPLGVEGPGVRKRTVSGPVFGCLARLGRGGRP